MEKNGYKIYTRGGDYGETSLLKGERVPKDDLRIEACGDLDELNAHLGVLLTGKLPAEDRMLVADIQNRLFDFGVCVAAVSVRTWACDALTDSVMRLEQAIDDIQRQVRMPRGFVLPGGSAEAAWCHVCRTVCRRVERHLCALREQDLYDSGILPYMNRLSDYLYALSLKINFKGGCAENLWQKRCRFEK